MIFFTARIRRMREPEARIGVPPPLLLVTPSPGNDLGPEVPPPHYKRAYSAATQEDCLVLVINWQWNWKQWYFRIIKWRNSMKVFTLHRQLSKLLVTLQFFRLQYMSNVKYRTFNGQKYLRHLLHHGAVKLKWLHIKYFRACIFQKENQTFKSYASPDNVCKMFQ